MSSSSRSRRSPGTAGGTSLTPCACPARRSLPPPPPPPPPPPLRGGAGARGAPPPATYGFSRLDQVGLDLAEVLLPQAVVGPVGAGLLELAVDPADELGVALADRDPVRAGDER